MNQIGGKQIILVSIAIVVIIAGGYFVWNKINNQKTELFFKESLSSVPLSVNIDEYIGVISINENSQNVYTNNKYGFQFVYPKEWRVGDNHLGYGTFQIFNYDESEANGKSFFSEGHNKIEVVITSNRTENTSPDYPEEKRITRSVIISGQPSTRYEIQLTGGQKIFSYIILLPTHSDKYLGLRMYGDPSNFYVLDDLVKSLKWTIK